MFATLLFVGQNLLKSIEGQEVGQKRGEKDLKANLFLLAMEYGEKEVDQRRKVAASHSHLNMASGDPVDTNMTGTNQGLLILVEIYYSSRIYFIIL